MSGVERRPDDTLGRFLTRPAWRPGAATSLYSKANAPSSMGESRKSALSRK